jgi:hypothetical protein
VKIEGRADTFQLFFIKSDGSGHFLTGIPYTLWDVTDAPKQMRPLFAFEHPNEPEKVPQVYAMLGCDLEVREGANVVCTIRLRLSPLSIDVEYH